MEAGCRPRKPLIYTYAHTNCVTIKNEYVSHQNSQIKNTVENVWRPVMVENTYPYTHDVQKCWAILDDRTFAVIRSTLIPPNGIIGGYGVYLFVYSTSFSFRFGNKPQTRHVWADGGEFSARVYIVIVETAFFRVVLERFKNRLAKCHWSHSLSKPFCSFSKTKIISQNVYVYSRFDCYIPCL